MIFGLFHLQGKQSSNPSPEQSSTFNMGEFINRLQSNQKSGSFPRGNYIDDETQPRKFEINGIMSIYSS